jgi:uncharacterized protein
MLPPLCSDDRQRLLRLSRRILTEVILYNRLPELSPPTSRLAVPAGAFVTLYRRSQLRGCVGLPGRSFSVSETVVQATIGAARNDPRFPAVTPEELPELEIEISVLSEPQPIAADGIEPGRHGLVVVRGKKRGLLLPQVAQERGWSAQRFLQETCRKAGLEPGAAEHPETQVLAFTAEVFSEREFWPATAGTTERSGPLETPEAEE